MVSWLDIGTKWESSLPSFVELFNHHNITNFIFSSITVSYHRFPEKQADGCNLCRSTVFLSEPAATKLKALTWTGLKSQGVVGYLRRVDANKTDLLFFTTYFTSMKEEPKVPEEAHQAKPDGISCLLLSNYRRCVKWTKWNS